MGPSGGPHAHASDFPTSYPFTVCYNFSWINDNIPSLRRDKRRMDMDRLLGRDDDLSVHNVR